MHPTPTTPTMAIPQKPWKLEYAKSSRSWCKTCKKVILKEKLRLGIMVEATQFDGCITRWNHADCILKKSKQIKSVDDVEGIESVRWEDQQKIRKYVEGIQSSNATPDTVLEFGIEVSQTSRAVCRHCKQKIMKREIRVFTKSTGKGAKILGWHHANCFIEQFPSAQLEELSDWHCLSGSDQAALTSLVTNLRSTGKNGSTEEVHGVKGQQSSSAKPGTKRRKDGEIQKFKFRKLERDCTMIEVALGNDAQDVADSHPQLFNLEDKLEAQTKALWNLKDDLKRLVTMAELREMLETNGQDSTGSELDLRDRCADGMMFGALASCHICSGSLRYSGGMYGCHSYLSAWSKCSYSTPKPERIKGKWKVPVHTTNEFLKKWFKSQKGVKPIRILPPKYSTCSYGSQATDNQSQILENKSLEELKVNFSGSWSQDMDSEEDEVIDKINGDPDCSVANQELVCWGFKKKKARRMKRLVIRHDFAVECFKEKKKLPDFIGEISTSRMMTVKVKGRNAVNEYSGLQKTGHILEEGTSIYNTTLNMSDLSTDINSYYILQIIQHDRRPDCYVFRKWGRVGNECIGGDKIEKLSKPNAICEFKRLFLEKTGNSWEAWEKKQDFQKRPGKYFPLDIDYGMNKQLQHKIHEMSESQLPPPLAELMRMLFNVETYRATMMEFEVNLAEMPLGKLSKYTINRGFEALTEIQNLLNSSIHDPSIKESLIIDASNRFFTTIPSIHPHVIRDEKDFKSKVKMLEALQDIEIASRLVGFDVNSEDYSIDEKYKKLQCDISPIPHDSEDYRLIEKYLLTTQAPSHKAWCLELEEAFTLDRDGEFSRFSAYGEKLTNRMLLWHGSRLTNFVGILSQGLRIAPPNAPATGYMFGKGIYFADLVSKSAQYCYTNQTNPVGLMLLSEVALGEVYELKNSQYMEKPPPGKHSTKGLGQKVPNKSEHVIWKEDIVVPCGKPVASRVKLSELMYNEYIVYDTAQVKMQFLLKVKFHHKR